MQKSSAKEMLNRAFVSLALLLSVGFTQAVCAQEQIELKVKEPISDQVIYSNPALIYRSGSSRAAVLVHQSGAKMESWSSFAQSLNDRDITALSLSISTAQDVEAAVHYLRKNNYEDIILVGASIGGGAIMQALSKGDWPNVRRIVLLAPSTGPALTSSEMSKLFLVSKADFFKSRTYSGFEEASDPKTLIEYEGRDHGQALLDGVHGEAALKEIMTFLNP